MTGEDSGQRQQAEYQSGLPFNASGIDTLAVYCSDGRFGVQVDDFLQSALRMPRCDRLVIPGGPGCLAGYFAAFHEEAAAKEQIKFLVRCHKLTRIVLIGHDDCGFYKHQLNLTDSDVSGRQSEDLVKVAHRLRLLVGEVRIEAFMARKRGDRVWFGQVDLTVRQGMRMW